MKNIRTQFPILNEYMGSKQLIYFDNAATSQKPKRVIERITQFYEKENSNVHRSLNPLAERATKLYEDARCALAGFIGAKNPEEIIFTRNATEGINLVAKTWCRENLKAGDVVLLTELEHHSNIIPFLQLKNEIGAEVRFIPVTPDGEIDLKSAKKFFSESRVKFFSCTLASNVLGNVTPGKLLIEMAKEKNIPVMVDAAQFAAHFPVSVTDLNCDFLVFSGHKLYGPTGIGVLWMRQEFLNASPPFLGGGEMVKVVRGGSFEPKEPPFKFEAGTPHIAGAIGLASAIEFLQSIGWSEIIRTEEKLTRALHKKLKRLSFVKVFGQDDASGHLPIAAFTVSGVHPHDVADVLGNEGICIRAGHHCAIPLHRALGVNSTARASLAFYNTEEEIDAFIDALKEVHKRFQ